MPVTSISKCDLHIPHKSYMNDLARALKRAGIEIPDRVVRQEHDNLVEIERWAAFYNRNCGCNG